MEEFENILTDEQKARFDQIKKDHHPDKKFKKFDKKKHDKKHNKKDNKD